jgi:NitT/TauT family transport system permease protein
MIRIADRGAALTAVVAGAALVLPLSTGDGPIHGAAAFRIAALTLIAVAALIAAVPPWPRWRALLLVGAVVFGCVASLRVVHGDGFAGHAGAGFWVLTLALWAAAWRGIDDLGLVRVGNAGAQKLLMLLIPAAFGLWVIYLWEIITVGFDVPQVLLPAPSVIAERFASSLDILWADFRQTFIKAVITGYVLGCGSAFLTAILIDRIPFLQRGLLPLGNMVSALPIVGIAPIMVMWFGFDWPSKAAVVVVMTFFPMLVNTVTGLAASGRLERDLMHSYGAGYWQTLVKLRLPAAMPFIFNALKINSTLALIGAIVAEFFGTPIVGMGFRISTEVGRMNVDMVWAEIVMAALAGSAFYGLMASIERAVTSWHPSYRRRHGA